MAYYVLSKDMLIEDMLRTTSRTTSQQGPVAQYGAQNECKETRTIW